MLSAVIAIGITLLVFWLATKLHQRFSYPLLNPFLISVLVIIAGLLWFGISYQDYNQGAKWLTALLEPAVVALGVPLYAQLQAIRNDLPAFILVVSLSALLAIGSTVLIAIALGVDELLVVSLVTHSVTTPIAIAVATPFGAKGSLVAMGVLISGLIGALFAVPLLRLFGINSAKAQGVAIGSATHALGTATIMKQGETQGAYSALALVLCAIITALVTPVVLPWLLAVFA